MYFPSLASSATVPSAPSESARSSASADAAVTSAPVIWPPSKAISRRTVPFSAMCYHRREDSVDGVGMDERDLEAEEALPRLVVDQLRAAPGEVRQRLAQVVDLVGDVVHARPAAREELAHRRVRAERGEQLDTALADADRSRLDALLRHELAVLELGAEETLVRGERLVEVLDGDAEVVDAARRHGD